MNLTDRRRGFLEINEGINPTVNLFDPTQNTITTGRYISYINGTMFGNTTSQRKAISSYIPVKEKTRYIMTVNTGSFETGSNAGFAFYDENKTFISGFATVSTKSQTFETPEGCKYYRTWVNGTQSVAEVLAGIELHYA